MILTSAVAISSILPKGKPDRLMNVIAMDQPSIIEEGEMYLFYRPVYGGKGIILANKQLPAIDNDEYERRKVLCFF